jgi:hypothetical protein
MPDNAIFTGYDPAEQAEPEDLSEFYDDLYERERDK